jgi:hypothetical protein
LRNVANMEPFSDLTALLQDGYSFQYNLPGHGIQDVRISTHQIGELILTSGKLLACDLLIVPDDRYFIKESLKPGRYPVIVSVADFHPTGDTLIACAMLRINEEATVKWEVAAINEPNTEQKNERYSYGVDSGTGSFMDVDAAQIISQLVWEESSERDKFEEFCDSALEEMEKHSFGRQGTASWAIMRVSDGIEANVVMFSSGWGDGGYASFWGRDASGKLTSLVTDFALFGKS